jgi:hypothetical protein
MGVFTWLVGNGDEKCSEVQISLKIGDKMFQ